MKLTERKTTASCPARVDRIAHCAHYSNMLIKTERRYSWLDVHSICNCQLFVLTAVKGFSGLCCSRDAKEASLRNCGTYSSCSCYSPPANSEPSLMQNAPCQSDLIPKQPPNLKRKNRLPLVSYQRYLEVTKLVIPTKLVQLTDIANQTVIFVFINLKNDYRNLLQDLCRDSHENLQWDFFQAEIHSYFGCNEFVTVGFEWFQRSDVQFFKERSLVKRVSKKSWVKKSASEFPVKEFPFFGAQNFHLSKNMSVLPISYFAHSVPLI